MVVLDRNWRCDAGEIDLVLRDGSVLVVCEVKTRSGVDYGHPHEAVTPAKVDRLIRLGVLLAARPTACAAASCGSTWSACCAPRKGPSTIDHVRGWSDAVRDGPHDLAPGRARPPHRRPGRRVARPGRHDPGRPPRRLAPRGPRPVPDGDRQQPARVAGDQADHDPAVAGRPAQERHPLRPRDRRVGARRRRPDPAGSPRGHGLHRRADPHRRAALGARRAADGDGRGRARASPASSCRSRRPARQRWCPAWRCSACARWPRSSPSCAATRCPRRRRSRPCRAAGCCRGAVRSGWRRSTWPTCSACPTPATPSRSRRPAATT